MVVLHYLVGSVVDERLHRATELEFQLQEVREVQCPVHVSELLAVDDLERTQAWEEVACSHPLELDLLELIQAQQLKTLERWEAIPTTTAGPVAVAATIYDDLLKRCTVHDQEFLQ